MACYCFLFHYLSLAAFSGYFSTSLYACSCISARIWPTSFHRHDYRETWYTGRKNPQKSSHATVFAPSLAAMQNTSLGVPKFTFINRLTHPWSVCWTVAGRSGWRTWRRVWSWACRGRVRRESPAGTARSLWSIKRNDKKWGVKQQR